MIRSWIGAVDAVRRFADLAADRVCGGCGRPSTRWCRVCAVTLPGGGAGRLVRRDVLLTRPTLSAPGPAVWSAASYDGPVREAINAWKDHGRADLTPMLAGAVAGVLGEALTGALDGEVLLVPVPSAARARRRRGREPVRDLAREVARSRPGLRMLPVLRHRRQIGEQPGLGRVDRTANLAGALDVASGWSSVVAGRRVLVVDDVVTSGATLAEAARALAAAGCLVRGALTVAATARTAK